MGKVLTYIEVREPTELLKNQLVQGIPMKLDTSAEFALSLTKLLEELSELGNIKTDAALPISLPYSDVNNLVLEKYAWTNVGNPKFKPLAIRIVSGAKTWHYDSLFVLQSDDVAQEFLCEVGVGAKHWITLAEQCLVKDIVKDTMLTDYTNILLRQNVQKYTDGDAMHQWPLINYGIDVAKGASHKYLRPWFYMTAIIKEGLCKIGWNLDSNFIESDYMRKFILYILKADWQKFGGKGTGIEVHVTADPAVIPNNDHPFPLALVIAFSTWTGGSNFNPGWYNDATPIPPHEDWAFVNKGAFAITVDAHVFVEIQVDGTHGIPPSNTSTITIAHYDTVPVLQSYLQDSYLVTFQPQTFTAEIFFNDITLQPGDSIRTQSTGGRITNNSFFEISVQEDKQTNDTDIMQMDTIVLQDLTLLDVMGGIIHIWNLKLSTAWGTRTLGMHLPERHELPDTTFAEGFFKTDKVPFNIDRKVICESMVRIFPETRPARYIRLKFINSTDIYNIEERGVVDLATQPYQKTIDLGPGLTEEEVLLVNPLFEPTLHAQADSYMGSLASDNIPVVIPFIWDNNDNKNSCNIKPRIIYYAGNAEQPVGTNTNKTWERDGTQMFVVPTGAQHKDYITDIDPVAGSNAIYGDLSFGDGFSLGWEQQLLEAAFALTITLEMIMCLDEYERMNFRELIYFTYRGIPHVHKLLAIEAFSTDEFAPTTLLLRAPINQIDAYCPPDCDLPCEGDIKDCLYNTEMGNLFSDSTIAPINLCEAMICGIQYITGPCADLGSTVNLANVGGINVVTNFIDAINSLGLPGVTASLPTPGDLTTPPAAGTDVENDGRALRLQFPACCTIDIQLWIGEVPYMRLTELGSFVWNAGWVELTSPPFASLYYPDVSQYNCVTTNDCS